MKKIFSKKDFDWISNKLKEIENCSDYKKEIELREELAHEYENQGLYIDSAKMHYSIVEIIESHPELGLSSDKHLDKNLKLKSMNSFKKENKQSTIPNWIFSFMSLIWMIFGIIFLSPNITGGVILEDLNIMSWMGFSFLVIGIVFGMVFIKRVRRE